MMTTKDFLFELGTEELPPQSLLLFTDSLKSTLEKNLGALGLTYKSLHTFATPRRLAVLITELITHQPPQAIERKGPATSAAYDANGHPSKALEGFLRANNATLDELQSEETPKGTWLLLRKTVPGASTEKLLPGLFSDAIKNLPIAKPMRWGDGTVEFIRPVHWLIMLFDNTIIDCEMLGLKSGRHSVGHRFHHPESVEISAPAHYVTVLRKAFVIADFEERKAIIRANATQQCEPLKEKLLIDEDLLNEVTAINEWPVPLRAEFATEFLEVPSEALISAMQHHQKCFPILDPHGKLLSAFVFVANIESKNPTTVVKGNERVMKARLSDASFFYHGDRKIPLDDQMEKLKTVLFQEKLGTVFEKTQRIEKLGDWLSSVHSEVNKAHLKRAAKLCKADLVSDMVGEFPELQGIMGRYYAEFQNENSEVICAIEEHYQPRHANDSCPKSTVGALLSIADRMDTLAGIFSIGQRPTGNKDPFALRRAAMGLIKTALEHQFTFSLMDCIREALKSLPKCSETEVADFIWERFRGLKTEQGFHTDVVSAVLAANPTSIYDADQRIHAVAKFCTLDEAKSLAAANKRVRNIIEKAPTDGLEGEVDIKLFKEDAEQALYEALRDKLNITAPLSKQGKYSEALHSLATLRAPVDRFFDDVHVMTDDHAVQQNRIKLLRDLRAGFIQIADISQLQNMID